MAVVPFPDPVLDTWAPDVWSGAELPADRVRALAVGAWWAHSWNAPHDVLPLGARAEAVGVLEQWWGVAAPADAHTTTRQLLSGMHAPLYTVVNPLVGNALKLQIAAGNIAAEHRLFLRDYAAFSGHDCLPYYEGWLRANQDGQLSGLPFGRRTDEIVAFDLVRAAFMARACRTAEYFDDDAAWQYLLRGLELARQHYRNWGQLSRAYLTGYAFWKASQDLSGLRAGVLERRQGVVRLHTVPTSPWRRYSLLP